MRYAVNAFPGLHTVHHHLMLVAGFEVSMLRQWYVQNGTDPYQVTAEVIKFFYFFYRRVVTFSDFH